MNVYSKNIYEVIENGNKKHIIIIYNISKNHYVGLSVHHTKSINFKYFESINRFIDMESLQEYHKSNIKRFSICKRYIFKNKRSRF